MRNRSNPARVRLDMRTVSAGVVFFFLLVASLPKAECSSGLTELNMLANVRLHDSTRITTDFGGHVQPLSFTDEQTFKSLILRHRFAGFEVEKIYRSFPLVRDELDSRFCQLPANRFVQPFKKIFKL